MARVSSLDRQKMLKEGIWEYQEGRKNTQLFSTLLPILKEKDHKKQSRVSFEKGRQSESQGCYETEERDNVVPNQGKKWSGNTICSLYAQLLGVGISRIK